MPADLTELELDVEHVRQRLAGNLSRLMQPSTLESAKNDVLAQAADYKAEAVAKIKQAASDKVSDVLHGLRVRAERNPAAAAAVLAGAVCHVSRSKAVGSIMVAAGLSSLVRTPSDGLGSQTPTTDAVRQAAETTYVQVKRASAATVEQIGRQMEVASDVMQTARSRIAATTAEAGAQIRSTVGDISSGSAQVSTNASDIARRTAHDAADRISRFGQNATDQIRAEPLRWGALALLVGFGASWLSRRRD